MASPNSVQYPCELLKGKLLTGDKRDGTWTVLDKIEKRPDSTGGTFSVGYKVQHDDGTLGFLKATDTGLFTRASKNGSQLERFTRTLNEQAFERNILNVCFGNNMDRVIHAIDYGTYESSETGVRDYVFFIVFDLAKGDVRQQILHQKRQSLSWALTALHNLAVAVQQLHNARIAHNDIKPSNLLVFDDHLQKLADLGRATSDDSVGPWDGVNYVGDRTYAAPEFFYRDVTFKKLAGKIIFPVRQASDLYLLGSMAFFLVTGQTLTPLLGRYLRPEHWHTNWTGTYEDVLPYLRDALGLAMQHFQQALPTNADGALLKESQELVDAIFMLCEPDPNRRGQQVLPGSKQNQYSIERLVSKFDRLSKRMAIIERVTS